MALLFCESFDHYTSTTDMALKWNVHSNSANIVSGRYGNGLNCGDSITEKWLSSHATWIVGFAMKPSTAYPYLYGLLLGINDDSTRQISLGIDTNRRLYVERNGTLLGTGSTVLRWGFWSYIEIKVTIDNSSGVVALKVNGVSETISFVTGTATTQDTQHTANATASRILLLGTNRGWWLADDIYVCDGSGSVNNDFLGDVRVQSIFPSGAGATTQMTPSAGSNYECVDETAPNADTDYVSETTAGQKDTYAFGNLTPTSGTIKGVQVLINARKDDAGSRSIAPVYRPVSTDYDGTTVSVGDSYGYYSEIKEVSPATSAAWTISEVNGAEFGVKLVS